MPGSYPKKKLYKITKRRLMARKVCILTSVHPPFDFRIFHKEAKSLARAGYDVTLIAQHGKDEIVDGIRIVPLSKPKDRLERMARTVWLVYRKALEIDADIYHFHDPELIPIGILLKRLAKKVIYDVHEDVPRQTFSKNWIPKIIRYPVALAMGALEWGAAKSFDAIVPATPKIAERFPTKKTVVVQNFPIGAELVARSTIPYEQRALSFAYVGGIATIRGAIEMISAFDCLHDITGARLELAGEFSPSSLEDTLRALPGWTLVHYHGQVSRAQVARILGGVRAGVVLFHSLPNHIDAQPNKMFEYMSAAVYCDDPADVLTTTQYAGEFVSAFSVDNLLGVQFHPEKSHKFGASFFRHYAVAHGLIGF